MVSEGIYSDNSDCCCLCFCLWVARVTSHVTSAIPPTTWPPQVSNGQGKIIPLPLIQIEVNGVVHYGRPGEYSWSNSVGDKGGGAIYGSSTAFVLQKDQIFKITHNQQTDPISWIIVEFDDQGIPVTAISPQSGNAFYTFVTAGNRILKITAQWARDKYVTYHFSVQVMP